MKKEKKSKDQIVKELRKRISELEKSEVERKKAEEALRFERDNLNSIFEAMEDGVYIVNQQFDIQYVNPVLEKDFGNYQGRKCYEYFHDRTEVCPWCKNPDVFAGKTVRWEWYSFKNQRTYDLIDTPLKNPDGSISKLEIFHDITERKKAEDLLKKQKKELSEFAHTVSHALKNYIGIIRICAQFLLLRRKYTEKYVQRIDDMVTKIDEFITQQLQLANAGRAIGEPEEIDLNTVIDEIGKMYSIEIYSEDLPTITGDPRRLREAFHNLIDNAIKHGEANMVEISSEKKKDSYVIYVKDNGRGISKEDIDKIFDIGYSKRGTGFGLTIVKKIVEAHGGSISVKSEEEKGAVFELVLPIKM